MYRVQNVKKIRSSGTHAVLVKCPHHKEQVEISQMMGNSVVRKPNPSKKFLDKKYNNDQEKIEQVTHKHDSHSDHFCEFAQNDINIVLKFLQESY